MRKKTTSIPVNYFDDGHNLGIAVERLLPEDLIIFKEAKQAHRHDFHSFFFLEKGSVSIEIDFKRHHIESPSVIYMHPNQVHLILASKNVTVSSCAINNENLNPEYLKLLEGITPAKPLFLEKETFSIISEAVSLCINFFESKHRKLYHSILKDSCNALVALVISQYMERSESAAKPSRFEMVTKIFNETLERNYSKVKSPAAYAEKLNISTAYLNECVKNTTGYSVSHHVQQRIILEAKRLLYHSDKSVKEIATELGFDDYPYFSRVFTKVAGITALAFRSKNHD
ncbi:helix-turn-helix domain-containing protein [Pedobacter metabolipauper]|uniref:AraC-like DNA-binding protein n=1 Tax=Pedobacter metabolipauper TaxID=425513 RepID=A0A4R6SZ63_9SPHI|nr:helix-turn-helix domain-containing protein [Pedobacter metabolipauper]TDQ11746.1 AraC-like DNA-binding protein [Pedobacter metabolipauper]